jgi:hypothetical protein
VRHVEVRQEIVVRRACLEDVKLTEDSECRQKVGDTVMHCTGLRLTKFKGCEELEIQKGEKE